MTRTQPNRRRHVVDTAAEEFGLHAVTAPEPPPAAQRSRKPAGVPEEKEKATVGFNFKMTPTNHRRLKALAEADERSLQYMLDKIVWPEVTERETMDKKRSGSKR